MELSWLLSQPSLEERIPHLSPGRCILSSVNINLKRFVSAGKDRNPSMTKIFVLGKWHGETYGKAESSRVFMNARKWKTTILGVSQTHCEEPGYGDSSADLKESAAYQLSHLNPRRIALDD